MITDGQLDFGIKAQAANAADSGALGSTNVLDCGESKILFDGTPMWLFARFSVTQCATVVLTLRGDTTAATLATAAPAHEDIVSTGTIGFDEEGTALADDATERFIQVRIPIPKQKLPMQYYGLWITTGGGTDEVVGAGDAVIVRDAPNNQVWAREAAPA